MGIASTAKKEGGNIIKWGLIIGFGVAVFVPLVQWISNMVMSKFKKPGGTTA